MRQKKNKNELSPVGKSIKKRLIDLNMTQEALAKVVGVNVNYLGLIIYGYRSGNKYMNSIEKVLGISLEKYKKSA
jgi:transcriptional regulator with XRE-family HTH domain